MNKWVFLDVTIAFLFMQIDCNRDNQIDWDDFSTYMLMRAEGEKVK
jgi:predicted nucleic acid-binding protein